MSGRIMIGARIPPELKRLVDADDRDNQDVVEAALWKEFGGRKKSALEAKKEHKLHQLEAIEASIESEQEDKQRVLDEIESLDTQIQSIAEERPVYEDDINGFLDMFAESRAVFPRFKSEVEELSSEHNKSLKQVVNDIQSYADENEFEIAEERWTDAYGDGLV